MSVEGSGRLRIRLLGELQLRLADAPAVTLPASRKTRALLGYLVATGGPHRRERLCDLFWEGPSDPRAELRWSLSKIRPLLNDPQASRLIADRERVAFEARDVQIDLTAIRGLLGHDVSTASVDALKTAARLFEGEFLDGLDLPGCYRYQEWCIAQREAVSTLRLTTLGGLVERLMNRPEEALVYARALATADPLSEAGHAAVVRLLGQVGRKKEALGHYEHARRLLETELGAPPSGELERARRDLNFVLIPQPAPKPSTPDAAPTDEDREIDSRAIAVTPFIGRLAERALLDDVISAAFHRRDAPIAFVTGEPGIGKSRLLEWLRERATSTGCRAYGARAFEAEMARPYAIWIDLLRTVARDLGPDETFEGLGPLVPERSGPHVAPADQTRLFDGVVSLLRRRLDTAPMAMTLDDLQWIDQASSSLLHYVARTLDARGGLLLACAARVGELSDNPSAASTLRSLERDGRVQTIRLRPLSADETAELVRAVDPTLDAADIFAQSEGNPLFIRELAKTHERRHPGRLRTINAVIAEQLARLRDRSQRLLVWAAALGRSFTLDLLARAAPLQTSDLLASIDELERQGIIQPAGHDTYDFVHDLVRKTTYESISQPRRRLLHRQVAQVLATLLKADDAVASELARHAALCDDHELAARACIRAGERCLRVFANAEAGRFAERGLWHLSRLQDSPFTVELSIALFNVRILAAAGPGMRPLPPLVDDLSRAVADAEARGLHSCAAAGHHLLSVLHQEAGERSQAQESTLRAAVSGRTADEMTRARQLANTARCLIELETEIGRARSLIDEAGAVARSLGANLCELHWARGLLERWDGQADEAVRSIGQALALARIEEDRWREYKCLTWLAMVDLERGLYGSTEARCAELMQVAQKLGEEEVPFVMTLEVLAGIAQDRPQSHAALSGALDRLRSVDDKFYLAYALNVAASLHLQRDMPEEARACATEALAAAQVTERPNEVALAQLMLARVSADTDRSAPATIETLSRRSSDRDAISRRVHLAVADAAAKRVPANPTLTPTFSIENRKTSGGAVFRESLSKGTSRRR